jgi:hypothetical protein
MPYRRLPNTDQARLRALKAAISKGVALSPMDLAFSQSALLQVRSFLPHFEQLLDQYRSSRKRQAEIGRELAEHFRMARLYVSHFLQVVNLSIIRGELKPAVRTFYGLDENDKSVPEVGTEQQLMVWGKQLISGEEKRMATGATRIYNPSLAMVKVRFDKFVELYNLHKDLLSTSQKLMEKVAEYRNQADDLITLVWNEIEKTYENLDPEEKRQICSEYGIVYVFRPGERESAAEAAEEEELL